MGTLKVLSPTERAAARQRQLEAAEAAAAAAEERRRALEASAAACGSTGPADESEEAATLARERAERDNHVLERARLLADESLPEVLLQMRCLDVLKT